MPTGIFRFRYFPKTAAILLPFKELVKNFKSHQRLQKDVKLVTSSYAVEEARRNLDSPEQREELEKLMRKMEVLASSPAERPVTIDLPQKDRPILLAAIESKADYLITGDFTHFGKYHGKTVEGVLILTPSEYLQRERKKK